MESLIRFRLLTSQLNQAERESFIQTSFNTFGSGFIITSIFDHFAKIMLQSQAEQYHAKHNQLHDLIQIISNMIESRDEFPSISDRHSLKLHQLPPELIGKTSSFLNTNDYLSFQRINREIYIGCNSPCKLHNFEVLFYHDEVVNMINWSKYSCIKSLGEVIFPDIIHLIKPFDQCLQFNMLHELIIGFNQQSIVQKDVDEFLGLKSIDVSKIHRLSVRYIGDANEDVYGSPSLLFKFLSAFSNLRYLELHSIALFDGDSNDYNHSNILRLFPHLQGLRVTLCEELLSKRFVGLYAEKLQILICDSVIDDLTISKLPKLQRLALHECNMQPSRFRDIINATNVLQKVKIEFDMVDIMEVHFQHIVHTIITVPEHIDYIEITCNYLRFDKLCKLTATALLSAKEKYENKDKLKIKLDLWFSSVNMEDGRENINWKEIIAHIKCVIDALNDVNIKDFMVCCSMDEWSEKINSAATSVFHAAKYTVNCHEEDQTFVITKINSQLSYQDEVYIFLH